MVLPTLVINRAADTDRLAWFEESAQAFDIEITRIEALDAHRPDFPFALYRDLLRDRFWESDQIKPGAIGCFLSHRLAWQHIVDNDLAMALICEDDAEFQGETENLRHAAETLPDFDVIFANARMSDWCAAVGEYGLKPLQMVLGDLAGQGGPKTMGLKPTPGGDCYLVSRKGAESLLQRTVEQGIVCGVDWSIVWNGIGKPDADLQRAFPELGVLADDPATPHPLDMFAISKPIADQRKGPSVLKHSVSVPIANLMNRDSVVAHIEAISTISLGNVHLNFACRAGPDPVMEAHRSGQIWDEPGLSALLHKFPQGGTFVDIGAHSGNHSVVIAKMGGAGRILAIEPNEEIHRLLRTNMQINGVAACFELHAPGVALASKPGKAWLLRNRRRSSETMVKAEAPSNGDDQLDAVDLITGDQWLNSANVDAIKIDTAGSEVDIVKGLKQTLRLHGPLILLDHAAQSVERIERLAAEIDYRIECTVASGRKNRASSLLIACSTPRRSAGR